MTSKTSLLSVRVNAEVLRNIDNLAGAAGLDRSEFVKLWLGAIARLKREHAVRALASLPQEMFKGLPGRPSDDDAGEREADRGQK